MLTQNVSRALLLAVTLIARPIRCTFLGYGVHESDNPVAHLDASAIMCPASWPRDIGISFKARDPQVSFFQPDRPTYSPRNGSIWLMKGYPKDYRDCLGSDGLGPPKMISVPQDVCLHGFFNNASILLREAAVCEDGTIPWMAIYQDGTCHSGPFLVNPINVAPGSFCLWGSPFWNETRIIRQFSVIFRCIDALEGSMPAKIMNAELDEPIVEDPPKPPECCTGFQSTAFSPSSGIASHIAKTASVSDDSLKMPFIVTIAATIGVACFFIVAAAALLAWSFIAVSPDQCCLQPSNQG
jgi:hypothetical protein